MVAVYHRFFCSEELQVLFRLEAGGWLVVFMGGGGMPRKWLSRGGHSKKNKEKRGGHVK